ncbi:MAG: hypothetical protein AB8H12_10905 [Lewinella sp.]
MFKQFFLPLFVLFAFSFALAAQSTPEEQASDDLDYYSTANDRGQDQRGDSFGQNLWFGTGAQLGFQGGNNTSFFQVGLSPIVGYKINNIISVGPRGSFAYNSYKEDFGNGEFKASFVTWSAGAFARAKIVFPFFAHIEYSLLNEVQNFDANGDPVRSTRAIPFFGGGVSQGGQGGGVGYEILILFRLSQADRIGDSPFEFRTGLNFNF